MPSLSTKERKAKKLHAAIKEFNELLNVVKIQDKVGKIILLMSNKQSK